MRVTRVNIALETSSDSRVLAYCDVTLDDAIAIRSIRIIERTDGSLLVAFPERQVLDKCSYCRKSNPVVNRYCGECGRQLDSERGPIGDDGKRVTHRSNVHPVSMEARKEIEGPVLAEYWRVVKETWGEGRMRNGRAVAGVG